MKKYLLALVILTLSAATAMADGHLQILESNHSVKITLDRLAAGLQAKGATIFARIDHAKGAAAIDAALAPTEVLIFGNPKLGTPLMQSAPAIGLDLPLKVLAWEDDAGKVWLAYTAPDALKQRYAIGDKDQVFMKITQILAAMTKAAAAE